MKILFAASEAVPFCKTGGLADVAGALPAALAAKRHTVRLVLPFYQQIREHFHKIHLVRDSLHFRFDGRMESAKIWQVDVRTDLRAYFIDAPAFFDRPGIYGETAATFYLDNDRRFAFFSQAIFELAKVIEFKPDIIHAHDWPTGLVMANLKLRYGQTPFFKNTSSVFTIHNMAYQGNFPAPSFHMTGLPVEAYSLKGLEFFGNVSYLKAGLVYADAINTVSPSYAKEISIDPKFGCGLEGVLQERAVDFQGILNGLDTVFWDPKRDPKLSTNFDVHSIEKRKLCKAALQEESGLTVDENIPLVGFIGRLDYQKGIDLLIEIMPSLLKEGVQFVSLGQGNQQYRRDLQELERRFPAHVYVKTDFAEPFAHKIYAGVDLFLMPSRYEPCGLGQMIAMRYGALPVVTPTGGLLDTVRDCYKDPLEGTGFIAPDTTSGAFLTALRIALDFKNNPSQFSLAQARAMKQDFSWKKSVKDYLFMYESILH